MTSRLVAVALGVTILATLCIGQDAASAWLPLRPGDTWVYQKEWLDAGDRDIEHPYVERWTTEETVVRIVPLPNEMGALATRRTRVVEHTPAPGFRAQNDSTRDEAPESHIIVRANCVFVLDGIDARGAACASDGSGHCVAPLDAAGHVHAGYEQAMLRGNVPADFCFPIVPGASWGQTATTNEYVWTVKGRNADSFGVPGAATFRLSGSDGSGSTIDRWFAEGIGVVQEVVEHHGTYWEQRRRLMRTTIGGKTTRYNLNQAHTTPLGHGDCIGPGWRHFARADGRPFGSEADCISALPR